MTGGAARQALTARDISHALRNGSALGGGPVTVSAEDLRECLTKADRLDPHGLVLVDATVDGRLDLADTRLDIPLVFRSCRLPDGFDASGASLRGVTMLKCEAAMIDLTHAVIERDLRLTGCDAKALDATGASAGGAIDLSDSRFTEGGVVLPRAVAKEGLLLDRAVVHGQVNLDRGLMLLVRGVGLVVENGSEVALLADGLKLNTSLVLSRARIGGGVSLRNAPIGADVEVGGARLSCPDGLALDLSGSQIVGDVHLSGAEIEGTIQASRTKVEGALILDRVRASRGEDDRALDLNGAVLHALSVDEFAYEGVSILTDVAVGAVSGFDACRQGRLDSSGWSVGIVRGTLGGDWKAAQRWLDQDVSQPFDPQPWLELSSALERGGRPEDARRLRYELEQRKTRLTPWRHGKLLRLGYKATTGYGLYPMRSLLWLAGIAVVTFVICLADPSSTPIRAINCAFVTAVPVSGLGADSPWQPNLGGVVEWILLIFRAVAWVLSTLLVAAIGGFLRPRS